MNKLFLFLLPMLMFACKKNNVDQAKVDRDIIHQYIHDHNLTADSTASGLFYVITVPGTGPAPTLNSLVMVYYRGYFVNDVTFDATTGTTASFVLNNVIQAWKEGIPLIKKGGKIKLLVPSALGYGSAGSGSIPGNSVLIFDVELVDFH